jgi:hypothetical protein
MSTWSKNDLHKIAEMDADNEIQRVLSAPATKKESAHERSRTK